MSCFDYLLFRPVAMRRHDSSLVPQSEMTVSLVNSIDEKADKMENVPETTSVDSNEFVEFGAFGYSWLESVISEPKLDAILADVASKLPSIDFDMSDVRFVDKSDIHIHFAYLVKTGFDLWCE